MNTMVSSGEPDEPTGAGSGPDGDKPIVWENRARGGWDEFQRLRDTLFLGLAVDAAIASAGPDQREP